MKPRQPPQEVPEKLPPWALTAECWLFPFWTSSAVLESNKSAPPSSSASTLSAVKKSAEHARQCGLPAGAFHPLEAIDESAWKSDAFKGGLGAWILYRYTDSPAGPYDELIYVAGFFKTPDGKSSTARITTIYVSTTASTWNGRRNWNIPKHVAEFRWSKPAHEASAGVQTVSVFLPPDSPLASLYPDGKPFFSASLQASRLPALPINTNLPIFPSLPLVQPPLRPCDAYSPDGRLGKAQIGTEEGVYRVTAPTFRGSFSLAYAKPLLAQPDAKVATYGDRLSFPEAKSTWSFGFHFRRVIVGFPQPQETRV